jgi:UDP-N-acetyl-D-mannosaminuronic acid transferase (WecB/TagA/CpsF family)
VRNHDETVKTPVLAWGHARESRYVVLANVHVVVTAAREPDFGSVVAAADPVLCERLGAAGYLYAQAHLDKDSVLTKFEADLQALVTR